MGDRSNMQIREMFDFLGRVLLTSNIMSPTPALPSSRHMANKTK